MKIGLCGSANAAAVAKAAGCDYLEMNFTTVARQSEEDFAQTKQLLAEADLPCEAMNCFIPGDFKLAQPGLDQQALQDYLAQGFARAKELGVEIVVFGSAGARRLPEGMEKPAGWEKLAPVYRLAGDCAARVGITIAIEPLSYRECNAVNTLRDGLALMRLAGHPNVRLLADMYHMGENGEDMDDILDAGADLRHCHIGRPTGRVYPMPGDGYDYAPFFRALRGIGYAGRLSVEAASPNDDPESDLPKSVALLRGLC